MNDDVVSIPNSFYPLRIRYVGCEEPIVVKTSKEIESGRSFVVLATAHELRAEKEAGG